MNKEEKIKELKKIYKYQCKAMEALYLKKQQTFKEYAEIACPFKVGETIDILGYVHKGKKGIVEEVTGRDTYGEEMEWVVRGFVLKKDGSRSLLKFDFNESNAKTGW